MTFTSLSRDRRQRCTLNAYCFFALKTFPPPLELPWPHTHWKHSSKPPWPSRAVYLLVCGRAGSWKQNKYRRFQSRRGAYFVDCTDTQTSSLFTVYSLKTQRIIQKNCVKGPPVLTVLLRIARITFGESLRETRSLFFVLYCHFWAEIISMVRHMYVRRSPKWTVLPASACYSQRGEWAAFTLSCSHSFGLILNISGSKTETRKAEFSCFIFVCNLQMLFLPFQKDWYTKKLKKKKRSLFWSLRALAVVWV